MSELTIEQVSLADLRAEYVRQSNVKMQANHAMEMIRAELDRRLAKNLQISHLIDKGKTHGEATDVIDGIKVHVGVRQSVSWDNERLKSIAAGLDPEVAEKLFTVKLNITETKFNAITDPKLHEKLVEARTVKLSEPSVEFVIEKGEING